MLNFIFNKIDDLFRWIDRKFGIEDTVISILVVVPIAVLVIYYLGELGDSLDEDQKGIFTIRQGEACFTTDEIQYEDNCETLYFFDKITKRHVIVTGSYCIYENKTD